VIIDGEARDVTEGYLASENKKDRARLQEEASRKSGASEAWASGSGSALAVERDPARSGSGEIQIVGVAFLDETGCPRDVLTSGEDLTIRLTYEAVERVEAPVFGVAIYRDDNLHVAGPNTKFSGYHISAVEGSGRLDFVIPRLPLTAGRYELSVSTYDRTITHKYDYLHRAFSFSVQPGSPWDTLGVLRLSGHWRLNNGDEDVDGTDME